MSTVELHRISPEDLRRAVVLSRDAISPRYDEVVRSVAAASGISIATIKGHRRTPTAAAARHLVWGILYREGYSYSQIARASTRDHTSIMHGVRRDEQRRAQA